MTTLTNKLSTPSMTLNPPIQKSFSKERQFLTLEKLSPMTEKPSTVPIKDGCPANINLTEPSIIIIQTDYDEVLSPASIIERC
jgi:hypothetical protein